jgi:hypothetical protein
MKHLIIIEGPDNTGKDTLQKNLQNKLGDCITFHFTSPPSSVHKLEKLNYQVNGWYNTWLNTKQSMEIGNLKFGIWNRSHLGEYVYGPMYRNIPTNLIVEEIEKFENTYFNSNDIKIHLVILIPQVSTVIKNDDGLSHSIEIEDKINEIYKFKQFLDITSIKDSFIYEVCLPNGEFKNEITIRDQILDRLDI